MTLDLAIRRGTVVTEEQIAALDVGISGGKIAALGSAVQRARAELDAKGLLVIPGGIDPHVHLSRLPHLTKGRKRHVDNFISGSRAAAAGGVTTIGNMTPRLPRRSLLASVESVAQEAARDSIVDFFLHPEVREVTDSTLSDLATLWSRGLRTVKFYMVHAGFDRHLSKYLQVMQSAARAGAVVLLHCEDGPLKDFYTDQLLTAGRGATHNYPLARPVPVEAVATSRAIGFCEATDARIYLVHVSSRSALEIAERARSRELPVHVETRPMYLYFTSDAFLGASAGIYVGNPPLRGELDREALWEGLLDGTIDTIASDHVSWGRADKLDVAVTVASARPGNAELETEIALLYTYGVLGRHMNLRRFVELTSSNAAKIFGLYPRKGVIALGSDADLAILDPQAVRRVSPGGGASRADYSLYEGWSLQGWPVITIRRGEVVFRDGTICASGRGRLVEACR